MKRESEKSNENNDSTKKQKLNDAELSKQMEAVRKRWDSSATFFRTQVEITTSQTMYTLLTWLEVSKMSAGQKILEVGCGSGKNKTNCIEFESNYLLFIMKFLF